MFFLPGNSRLGSDETLLAMGDARGSWKGSRFASWLVMGCLAVLFALPVVAETPLASTQSGTRPPRVAPQTLIPSGSVWRYLDDGSNQGTAWYAPDFDDSAWSSGPARLGYGDDGEVTVVSWGTVPNNRYLTTYFRMTFEVPDATVLGRLQLRLLRDDGVVLYLNGAEFARSNMPDGPINYRTKAATTVANESEQVFFNTAMDTSLFVSGTNVLAAEVHQFRTTSIDLALDLELIDLTGAQVCFGVADGRNNELNEDLLVQLEVLTAQPTVVGKTGTFDVEALAFDLGGQRLFGADAGQIVLFDLATGIASPLPLPAGSGEGSEGTLAFDDLDGLTWDAVNSVLYASQRRARDRDLLLSIDPATGAHIPDAFGPGVDYVVITGSSNDIDDIAKDPVTATLYGISNSSGGASDLVRIDPTTGFAEVVGPMMIDDVEGLAFFNDGQLFGSTGSRAGVLSNQLFLIDQITGAATAVAGFGIGTEFEGLGCLSDPGIATLGDRVWEDLDADGIQDPGEPGLGSVTVRLLDTLDGEVATTLTEADGSYVFTGLFPGGYSLVFEAPPDFLFSPSTQGGDVALDSDADTDGRTGSIALGSGEALRTVDAGLFRLASLGDRVWHDLDGDGIQDGGEPGIDGARVELLDAGGAVVSTVLTAGGGLYGFADLQPGTYRVAFEAPGPFVFSASLQGGDTALDSDAGSDGRSAPFALPSSASRLDIDAGLHLPTVLGDRVWHDLDGDGVQDLGEPGLDGLTVTLLDGAQMPLRSVVTSGGGSYSFTGLVPGTYQVAFSAPPGWVFTATLAGGDPELDSDADSTGMTGLLGLASGEAREDRDAGLYLPVSIGDRVWEDFDSDGVQDSDEPGLDGVLAELFDAGSVPLASTVTAGGGLYSFRSLRPGSYRVGFRAPESFLASPKDQGSDDELDSDADPVNGESDLLALSSGDQRIDIDAGFYAEPPALVASLGDTVWEDLDADGVRDAGEPGIQGVTVHLLDGSGNPLGSSAVTSASGFYNFLNLAGGTYRLQFVAPGGYSFSPPLQGGQPSLDSDADPSDGRTAPFVLADGESRGDLDAGLFRPASVGDLVWEDLDADGLWADEPGLDGVRVHLFDAADNLVAMITSAGGGIYGFSGLTPGAYHLEIERPEGMFFVDSGVGEDTTVDSDFEPFSGSTDLFILSSGEDRTDLDAGLSSASASVHDIPTLSTWGLMALCTLLAAIACRRLRFPTVPAPSVEAPRPSRQDDRRS